MKDKIKIIIEGEEYEVEKREFSTGSVGYGLYGKHEINKERYQFSINLVKL
jgi:hypothetical protein